MAKVTYPGVPTNIPQYASQTPSYLDFLNQGLSTQQKNLNAKRDTLSEVSSDAAFQGLRGIGNFGATGTPLGLATLNQILAGQGKTDPAMLNMQLGDISRSTQGAQMQTQEGLTQAGLQGSGMGQAIMAAIGQGGANQRQGAIAQETQMAEARKRQDLQLLLQLLIQPSLDAYAINQQASLGKRQNKAATMGAISSLVGGVVPG